MDIFCFYFILKFIMTLIHVSSMNHRCNPIAESDLAAYMLNCIDDQSKWNKIMDLGGPDEGMTMKEQVCYFL